MLAAEGARVLVVGSGKCGPDSVLDPIASVRTTVVDLGACLVERAGLDPANLTVLVDAETPQQVAETLRRTARDASDVLVFYYVGHGLVSLSGELHLATAATADLTEGAAGYQALPYSVVSEVLSRSRARLVLVVLDCCFSGRARGISGSAADDAFDNTGWIGSYLLTSTGRDQLAWAPPGERHTAFSGELIRIMREGDPLAPRLLTLDDVSRVLGRALSRRRLPPARRQAADGLDREPFVDNAAYVSPAPPGVPPSVDDGQHSPYRGLSSFRPDDRVYFFGRGELTRSLSERIRENPSVGRPWLVTGPSGSGKSSLLCAGLIPALSSESSTQGGTNGERLSCVYLTPGNDPLGRLAQRLAAVGGVDESVMRARLERDPASLGEGAWRRGRSEPDPGLGTSRTVLIVDQFEQVFTECEDTAQRLAFVGALGSMSESHDVTVVLGLRSDFFGHCADHPELLHALQHADVVPPMTTAELREVIEKPAELVGLTLETGLADLLLEECGRDGETTAKGPGGVLPLLSHALMETWQRRQGGVLTLAGYRATGGLARSLSQTADATLAEFPQEVEPLVRRMFLRMVRVEDGLEDTRRHVLLADLQEHLERAGRPEAGAVIGRFVEARLISVDGDLAEITHEALIRHWPRLRSWIEEDRSGVLVRQRIEESALVWDRNGRHPSLLDRGPRLNEAMTWAESRTDELGPLAQEFLRAGVENHRGERRAERRRVRLGRQAIASLVVLLILAVTGGGIAVRARSDAEAERVVALSRQVAARADAVRGLDPSLAMQLSLVAFRIRPTREAGDSLLSVSGSPTAIRLLGHNGPVRNVAFRPDARVLASTGGDDTVRFWDVGLRRQVAVLDRGRLPRSGPGELFWSGDGTMLLVGSLGEAPWQLWNVQDLGRLRLVGELSPTAGAWTAAVRPDGRVLAVSGPRGPTVLWDGDSPGVPASVLKGNMWGAADLLAFSPDGKALLEAPIVSYAGLWDVRDPRTPKLRSIVPDSASTYAAAFSRDSRRLAISGVQGKLTVFDVSDIGALRKVAALERAQDTSHAASLSFNEDGSRLGAAYASEDVVRIWDVASKKVVFSLPHVGAVRSVDFAAKGNSIATGGNDGVVRVWPLDAFPVGVHSDIANTVSFSPDGKTLASTGLDALRVWRVSGGTALRKAAVGQGQTSDALSVTLFGPDGTTLYTSNSIADGDPYHFKGRSPVPIGESDGSSQQSASGMALRGDGRMLALTMEPMRNTGEAVVAPSRIELWSLDAKGRRRAVVSKWPMAGALCVGFDPTGRLLAAGTETGAVRVWDVGDPARPRDVASVAGDSARANSVAFSPRGKVLAAAFSNGAVRLWEVSAGAAPRLVSSLADTRGSVSRLAFDRTGTRLATVGDDRVVRLYQVTDPRSPEPVATLQGHTAPVRDVAFSPVDASLATAGEDNTVRLWNTDKDAIASWICANSGSGITREEWRTYVSGAPYSPPCP
ncbi:caspase, EACC1-associated type [Streptosporangium carneum]|uniref:Peptidase C14 caspase domain-containing protein n=1 Tax=Streptosporangium carneum TaxID=47481 RepID=A0A9W6I7B2_9ACTN|nr:caspase family protein [Streptosporangium carneum]GLK12726.1 hypothetical protein GCM10017600_61360 [Streptosporangium carneum]